MSFGLSQLGLGDDTTDGMCYKLWSLKDIGIYQTGRVKLIYRIGCIMGNVAGALYCIHILVTENQHISTSLAT